MPQFVLIGHDGKDGEQRRNEHRDAHVAYIGSMNDAGQIVYAGPIKSEDGATSIGAVIIFEAPDLASARAKMDGDPYVAGGVYASLDVSPIKQVFPGPA